MGRRAAGQPDAPRPVPRAWAARRRECVVFYFGPGQGGDPQANAERWASQFVNADGTPATSNVKTRAMKSGGLGALRRDQGTYGRLDGGRRRRSQARLPCSAPSSRPDANWFFKLTGGGDGGRPAPAFEAMIGSMKRGGPRAERAAAPCPSSGRRAPSHCARWPPRRGAFWAEMRPGENGRRVRLTTQ
jgi:hypothetical protein